MRKSRVLTARIHPNKFDMAAGTFYSNTHGSPDIDPVEKSTPVAPTVVDRPSELRSHVNFNHTPAGTETRILSAMKAPQNYSDEVDAPIMKNVEFDPKISNFDGLVYQIDS